MEATPTPPAPQQRRKDFLERYAAAISMALTIAAAAFMLYGNQREIIAKLEAQTEAFRTYAQTTDKRLDRVEIVVFPPIRPGGR